MNRILTHCVLAAGVFALGIALSCGGMQRQGGKVAAEDVKRTETTRDDGTKGGKAPVGDADRRASTEAEENLPAIADSKGRTTPGKADGGRGAGGKTGGFARPESRKMEADKSAAGYRGADASVSDERSSTGVARPEGPSGLKAGFADDNRQYNYFVDFLNKYSSRAAHYPIDISERIILKVVDSNRKPVLNAKVKIFAGQDLLASGLTYSDGSFLFFPSEYARSINLFARNKIKRHAQLT